MKHPEYLWLIIPIATFAVVKYCFLVKWLWRGDDDDYH